MSVSRPNMFAGNKTKQILFKFMSTISNICFLENFLVVTAHQNKSHLVKETFHI